MIIEYLLNIHRTQRYNEVSHIKVRPGGDCHNIFEIDVTHICATRQKCDKRLLWTTDFDNKDLAFKF